MTRVIKAVLLLAGVALVLMPMAGVAAADDCVLLGARRSCRSRRMSV